MQPLTGRHLTPEHMDDDGIDEHELARALDYLTRLNRRLGGVAPTLRHLERLSTGIDPRRTISILDVGTGAADIPLAIAAWGRGRGRPLKIIGIDRHKKTLEMARQRTSGHEGVQVVQMDALRLSEHFAAGSFDFTHASLFLHHLPDLEAMTVMRMMDVLATRGVIISDLVRGAVARTGAKLATMAAGPMVRHDAMVSVEAGFRKREMLDLARRVGLARLRYQRHWLYRFTLVSEKA